MLSLVILGGIFAILVILLIIIITKISYSACQKIKSEEQLQQPSSVEITTTTKKIINKGPLGEAGNTIIDYPEENTSTTVNTPLVVDNNVIDENASLKSFTGIEINRRRPEADTALEDSNVDVD
jgi:hypothetical protein